MLEKMRSFLGEANKELSKVSWPNRPKVAEMTGIVAGCTVIFAVYLYLVDVVIYQVFRALFY